jgi:hypothetical protein
MSAEVIVFPDAVGAILSFLKARLLARGQAAEVGSRKGRETRFVRVTQAGGTRLDIARMQPRILVECWDPEEVKAYRLASLCAAELEAATRSQQPIAPGVWIGGTPEDFPVPVSFPDPLTASPRFQFVATPTLTGSAL